MAITNRQIPTGTRLAATYKKTRATCVVESDEAGKLAYVLEDGRRFSSLSAAGSAVMGGTACNGWRFWSIEGAEPVVQQPESNRSTRTNKTRRVIFKIPNQTGVPISQAKYFCNACMDAFLVDDDVKPEVCPAGHRLDGSTVTAPEGVGQEA